jgi:hypothetical protein
MFAGHKTDAVGIVRILDRVLDALGGDENEIRRLIGVIQLMPLPS